MELPTAIVVGATITLVGPVDPSAPSQNCALTVVGPGGTYDETKVGAKIATLPNGGRIFDACMVQS